jgi:hypothetical protein
MVLTESKKYTEFKKIQSPTIRAREEKIAKFLASEEPGRHVCHTNNFTDSHTNTDVTE